MSEFEDFTTKRLNRLYRGKRIVKCPVCGRKGWREAYGIRRIDGKATRAVLVVHSQQAATIAGIRSISNRDTCKADEPLEGGELVEWLTEAATKSERRAADYESMADQYRKQAASLREEIDQALQNF